MAFLHCDITLVSNSFKIQCDEKNLVSTSPKYKKTYEMLQFGMLLAYEQATGEDGKKIW